jgi:NTP pyrophosphatase (non-canonical NTP hydrolase)
MGYNLEQSTDYVNRESFAKQEAPRRSAIGPLNRLAAECHATNQHWWHHPATGERLDRNKGELLMLIVSEVAEAMEGERKNLMDDKLPHRRMAEVELADVLIRVFDYCGAYGYDLDGAVAEKRAFNAVRADHKAESRLAPGGKAF